MPVVPFPEFDPYRDASAKVPFAGVFVGGCVERGDGSSFRRKAHAHCTGAHRGWICVRSPKRLRNAKGEPSILMWHELAHLVSDQGHTAKFEATMRALCGRSDVVTYRKRLAASRKNAAKHPVKYQFQRIGNASYPPCTRGCGRIATGHLVRFKGNSMKSDATCEPCANAVVAATKG